MSAPSYVIDADALLDRERMRNGPMDIYWNQGEWIEPGGDLPTGPVPRRKLWQVALRCKPWDIIIRVAPPPDADLKPWGIAVAEHLGIPWSPGPDDARGVWITAVTFSRTAGGAIGSAGKVFQRLDGFQIGSAAIRVQKRAA